MSWAGRDRPLPPEMLPQPAVRSPLRCKGTILDRAQEEHSRRRYRRGTVTQKGPGAWRSAASRRVSHLGRSLERSVASLPPEYTRVVEQPPEGGDLKDWPRIAKLQSDLLVHALASRQTRVASYMLTKCQGLSRFPWMGHTAERHHEYTHGRSDLPPGQRILRDICRWHVEEFAYFVARLKSIPEGAGTLLDHTCVLFVHEHAEANIHKNAGLAMIVAGHAGQMKTGRHTRVTGTVGDVYQTLAEEVVGARIGRFPTGEKKLSELV